MVELSNLKAFADENLTSADVIGYILDRFIAGGKEKLVTAVSPTYSYNVLSSHRVDELFGLLGKGLAVGFVTKWQDFCLVTQKIVLSYMLRVCIKL